MCDDAWRVEIKASNSGHGCQNQQIQVVTNFQACMMHMMEQQNIRACQHLDPEGHELVETQIALIFQNFMVMTK